MSFGYGTEQVSDEAAGFGDLDAVNAEILRRAKRDPRMAMMTDEQIIGRVRLNPQFAPLIEKITAEVAAQRQPEPEYSTKDETRGYLANFLDNMLLGGADEFVGGMAGLEALFTDENFTDAYSRQKQQVLDDIDEYERRDPGHWIDPDVLGFAASMALPGSTFLRTGKLGTAAATGASRAAIPTYGQLARRGAALGAGYGAASGALEGEGMDRLTGAATGLGLGALGGAVLTPLAAGVGNAVGRRVRQRFGDPERHAADLIATAAVNDGAPIGASGDLGGYMARNPDAMMLDIGSEFSRDVPALARYAARNHGPGAAYAATNLLRRQRGLGDSVRDALSRLLGDPSTNQSPDDFLQSILRDRQNIGREMFEGNIVMRTPTLPLTDDVAAILGRVSNTDAPRAIQSAARIAGRPQAGFLPADVPPALSPYMAGRGALDTRTMLDLSSQLGKEIRAYGQRVRRGDAGASYAELQELRNLHREMLDWMDSALGGTYAPAREAYRANIAMEEAMDSGSDLLWSRDPKVVARMFNALGSETEREAFRRGALGSYYRHLPELASHDQVSKLQLGSRIPEIMRILARNPREYDAFQREIAELYNQHIKARSVFGNSDTAFNAAFARDIEGGNFGGALGQLLTGDVGGFVRGNVLGRAADWVQRGANQRVRNALSNMLFTSRNSLNQPPPITHGAEAVSIPRPSAADLARYIRLVEGAPERVAASHAAAARRGAAMARLPAQGLGRKTSADRQNEREKSNPARRR